MLIRWYLYRRYLTIPAITCIMREIFKDYITIYAIPRQPQTYTRPQPHEYAQNPVVLIILHHTTWFPSRFQPFYLTIARHAACPAANIDKSRCYFPSFVLFKTIWARRADISREALHEMLLLEFTYRQAYRHIHGRSIDIRRRRIDWVGDIWRCLGTILLEVLRCHSGGMGLGIYQLSLGIWYTGTH